jgi:hypothetical protein
VAEHIIPFPATCERAPYCMQATRIALIEERLETGKMQLDRIEDKVDAIRNWLLGAVLSTTLALVAIIVTLLRK